MIAAGGNGRLHATLSEFLRDCNIGIDVAQRTECAQQNFGHPAIFAVPELVAQQGRG